MITLRNIAAILSLAFSSTLFAATEFPGNLIPAEIAEQFTYGKIYRSLPDNFPVPVLPAGLNVYVLGSLDSGSVSQRILLGTTHTGAELREVFKTAYAAGGWLDLSMNPTSLELCHDTLGRLSFRMADPIGNENRILVTRATLVPIFPEPVSCAEQLAYQNGGPPTSPYAVFMEEVPLLDVPAATINAGPTLPFGRFSSSSDGSGVYYEREQDSTLTIPDYSLVELHEHFAEQMTQEGWQLDTDSVGVRSTTAVWFKLVPLPPLSAPVGLGMKLTAVMTLLDVQLDTYRVIVTVHTGNRLGTSTIGSGGFIGN